jgi:hypothetical protein
LSSFDNLEYEINQISIKDNKWLLLIINVLKKISKDFKANKIILSFINNTSISENIINYLNENIGLIQKNFFFNETDLIFINQVIDYLTFLKNYLELYKNVNEIFPFESQKIKYLDLDIIIKDLSKKCIEFCNDNNNNSKEIIELNKISWNIVDIYNEIQKE